MFAPIGLPEEVEEDGVSTHARLWGPAVNERPSMGEGSAVGEDPSASRGSAASRGSGPVVRVAIVDDHDLFRAGVRASLGRRSRSWARAAMCRTRCARSRNASPTLCCSTCTCPGAVGGGIRRVGDKPAGRAVPRAVGLRRGRRRDRADSSGRARVRDEDISGAGPGRAIYRVAPATPCSHHASPDSCSTRSPRRRAPEAGDVDPGPRPADAARAPGAPPHRAWLFLPRHRSGARASRRRRSRPRLAVLRKLQLANRHELTRWAVHRRLIEE